MWLKGLTMLLTTVVLLAGIACGGDGSSGSVSETPGPEDFTWVLQTMYGEPVLDGTYVWLRLYGDDYEGVDGCNQYGGSNPNGRPVVGDGGKFDLQSLSVNAMLCRQPDGVMDQADRYLGLLRRQGQSFRVDGDRLEVLDPDGEVGLIFVRQVPLAGEPVELAGTAWELVLGVSAGGDQRAANLVFLDDRHAVGLGACRGYVASYWTSDGRLRFPTRMATELGGSACSEEARRQEGQLGSGLSRAVEYSVSDEEGTRRLRIRTSLDMTVTFEALDAQVGSMSGEGWELMAILDTGQGDPDRSLAQRTDRLIPETVITARFHEKGVSGFGGCNFYNARLEPEGPIAREDGSFAKGTLSLWFNPMSCNDPPGVTEQESHFMGLIPQFERYRVYGELLVVHTSEEVVLLFRGG